jgi:cyclopropane-fatty-acyl-phospholipid synthase
VGSPTPPPLDEQMLRSRGRAIASISQAPACSFRCCRKTAVSNSRTQRKYIEGDAAARGLKNLRVVTADMNVFGPERQFDRIVSVEMFEHIINWRELMMRIRSWLAADGRLFMHVFTHHSGAYLFDGVDGENWIAQHFFTGGVMPSHHLIRQYQLAASTDSMHMLPNLSAGCCFAAHRRRVPNQISYASRSDFL